MPRLSLLLVIALALVMVPTGRAQTSQRSTAWFGLTLPPGLGDPHRPVLNLGGLTPAPAPALQPGETFDRGLTGAAIRQDLEHIVAFSRESRAAGDRAWGASPASLLP